MGSILAITDADGVFKEKRHFDAWGNIVKLEDGNGNALSSFDILDRGYTGHEHLLSVGIINMNGRLYDPLLHRFLSPDNFVQDPFNTQNFNRYGYVLNNPLMYTDPSGEFIFTAAIIVGAVAGAYFGGVQANGGTWNPLKWDWNSGDTYLGLGVGAVLGGVSAVAATTVATSIAVSGASALVSTATGGMVGGMISGGGFSLMPGGDGKFFKGVAIGGISGLSGGALGHIGANAISNVSINGIKLGGSALKGFAGGFAGGAGGGFFGGFASGMIETGNFELALKTGTQAVGMGAVIGGAMGFSTGYAMAKNNNRNPWTGQRMGKNIGLGRGMSDRINRGSPDLNAETITDAWESKFGLSKVLDSEGLNFNRDWLQSKMNQGYNIYDFGRGSFNVNGRYYGLELNMIHRYPHVYPSKFLVNYKYLRIIQYGN